MVYEGVKKGLFARSGKLLGMAARVARHEVGHKVGQTVSRSVERIGGEDVALRVKQARVIADDLSQLKGAAMKAGQLLSVDAADFLPPEALEVLAKLQSDAEPVPFETMRSVLVRELGADGVARLQGLSSRPAAAASIGQVHRAVVDGERVAVKIQYPEVAESIPSDLAMLRRFATSWLALAGRRIALDEMFEELGTILRLEADYAHEARCMTTYRERLADDPRFEVPTHFPELSSSRVLTMTWLDGQAFGPWMSSAPSLEARTRVARALLDLYCREFFDWGFVQTDPNPGNFLILEGDRVGLLDFGATLTYDEAFRASYVELLELMAHGDTASLVQGGVDFGILDARESDETKAIFAEMMRAAAHPFAAQIQPFTFGDEDYHRQTRDVVFRFVQGLRFTPPPRRLLFLHRKLGGLFSILKRLDVQLDLGPYWQRMVGAAHPDAVVGA